MINPEKETKVREFIELASRDVYDIPDEYFHVLVYMCDKAMSNQQLVNDIEKIAFDKEKDPEKIINLIRNCILNDKLLNK